MPLREDEVNPCSEASTLYKPSARSRAMYRPSASVTTSRLMPVSSLATFTVTPGSAPPVESVTVPSIEAVVCADATATWTRKTIRNHERPRRPTIEHPPSKQSRTTTTRTTARAARRAARDTDPPDARTHLRSSELRRGLAKAPKRDGGPQITNGVLGEPTGGTWNKP